MNNEKKIILLQFNLRISASGARSFFNFYIPRAKELVADDSGYIIEKAEKKKHYFLICVSHSLIKIIRNTLYFNSSSTDVTDEIINNRIKTKELELFDINAIHEFYKNYYFKNITIDNIQRKIRARGTATVNNFDFQIIKKANKVS